MASILLIRGLVAVSTALVATLAAAQSSAFRIAQVFSDMTGSIQFIELVESAGLDGQHRLAGLTLTSTHNGIVKRFTIARDLPTDRTANMSIIVSVGDFLYLPGGPTINFDSQPPTTTYNAYDADVPGLAPRSIPTDGGTLDFAGVDQITYETLPSDGANALYRGGSVAAATVPANDRCHVRRLPCEGRQKFAWDSPVAIEYYNATLDSRASNSKALQRSLSRCSIRRPARARRPMIPRSTPYPSIDYGTSGWTRITAIRQTSASATRWSSAVT